MDVAASPQPFESMAALKPLMDACVHCGFCLSTCPSYVLLGNEMDSPRGRIQLMRAGVDHQVPLTSLVVSHFDTCLGCVACETACPSGVQYGPLIEQMRVVIDESHRRPLIDRVFRWSLFRILPHPSRLAWLTPLLGIARVFQARPALLRALPSRLRSLVALAPAAPVGRREPEIAEVTPASAPERARVGLLTGCVQRAWFGSVNNATVRTLAAEGCTVHAPRTQGCCGALALHAGRDDEARDLARRLIGAFEQENVSAIVVNAAGCGSAMKGYGRLLSADPAWSERAHTFASKVQDVTETLAGLTPRATRHPITLRVAYHDACHLAHGQGITKPPRQVLGTIPGLTLVPLGENDVCCGSAGVFNLVQPDMAERLGQRKVDRIVESGADVVVTSNPGCILQIRAAGRASGRTPRVLHVVELLDASLQSASADLSSQPPTKA
jgi:glycolate oxidase iron-sulfur subunit